MQYFKIFLAATTLILATVTIANGQEPDSSGLVTSDLEITVGSISPLYEYYITPWQFEGVGIRAGLTTILGGDHEIVSPGPLVYGNLMYHPQIDRITRFVSGDMIPRYEILDPHTYQVLSSVHAPEPYTTFLGTHDIQFSPSGDRVMVILYERLDDQFYEGRPLMDAAFLEMDWPDMSEITFLWRGLDHFDPADSSWPLDAGPHVAYFDYAHVNSIDYSPDGSQIVASFRHLDEVTAINLDDGSIAWRLGGRHNQFNFVNDHGFSHTHDATFTKDGVLLFDNAVLTGQASRAIEYKLEFEEIEQPTGTLITQTMIMTATPVFSYASGYFTQFLGSAQRTDDGHTIIGWGSCRIHDNDNCPMITEVDRQGNVVFEVSLPQGLEDWATYRAYRYFRQDVIKHRFPFIPFDIHSQ